MHFHWLPMQVKSDIHPKLATEANPVFVNTLCGGLACAVGLFASNDNGDHTDVAQTNAWLRSSIRRCVSCIQKGRECVRDCRLCEAKQSLCDKHKSMGLGPSQWNAANRRCEGCEEDDCFCLCAEVVATSMDCCGKQRKVCLLTICVHVNVFSLSLYLA